jgi:hypothetical protein
VNIDELIKQVDVERLYRHIAELEGIKHHEVNPKNLDNAAKYIKKELKSYGLTVNEQKFSFDGLQQEFRNIEGVLGEGSKPEILITSHYDTVPNSPGANDNASGIAAMLEAARILANVKLEGKNIRFISFTLEELHPVMYTNMLKKRRELGLVDENDQYLSYHTQQIVRIYFSEFYRLNTTGESYEKAGKLAYKKLKKDLDDKETEYVEFLIDAFKELKSTSDWIGKTGLVGSTKWVKQALKDKKEIIGVLNLETIAYTSKQKHSQKMPSFLFKLFPKYKVNMRKEIGDFIAVIGDKNSRPLAKNFCKHCKNKSIDLPNMNLALPFSYEFMADKARDLLRSDHAPFLQHGIPALMITDTANFRYPYYHTEADTIDKLDFEFIKKVCQATIACAIDFV